MKLTAIPLLLAFSIPHCECGGGESESSVTVDGEDGVFVLAEARSADQFATIELERRRRNVEGQWLRLYTLDRSDSATFVLAEHDEASRFDQHEVRFSPDSSRVAYRLGEGEWSVVYLMPPSLAVHSAATHSGLDWTRVPEFEDAFVDLYDAQRLQLDDKFKFPKNLAMLRWVKERRGEVLLTKLLLDLVPLVRNYEWMEHYAMLSDVAKRRVQHQLLTALKEPGSTPNHFKFAWETKGLDLSDAANAELVARGAEMLAEHDDTLAKDGLDAAAYLEALASHDPAAASELGCALLKRKEPLPYALKDGRALATIAEATAGQRSGCDAAHDR